MKTLKASVIALLSVLLAGASARAGNVVLTTSDTIGQTSFNAALHWSNAAAPSGGNDYFTGNFILRTPPDGASHAFGGGSLTLNNNNGYPQGLFYKGTGSAGIITINNLILGGGHISHGNGAGHLLNLAGNISVTADSTIYAKQGNINISAVISGSSALTIPVADTSNYYVTFQAANSFTGNLINNGQFRLANGAVLRFAIGASNVNNRISGTGSATAFDGRFAFDLTGASTNIGSSWLVAGAANQTFGGSFSVDDFTKQGFGTGPGIWNLDTNGVYYEFVTDSGILSVVAAPSTNTPGSLSATSVKFEAVEADLLAGYAASYAASVGGQDNAEVTIANAVAGNNAINDQSGTGARMSIVGYYESANDVINQTTVGGVVNWLAGNDAHLSDVVAQGSTLGADLVVYICQCTDSDSIAGVAQQPGMYSALSPGSVWSAVFAHETGGHNYGRSHSDGFNANNNPTTVMLHNYCGGGSTPPYYFTNPKLWFKGFQLQGDGNNCGQGGLINGGDNSLPGAASAVSTADRRTRILTGPNLNNVVLRWLFTNASATITAGTTNFDLISNAPAVVRGNGAIYTGRALRLPGGTSGDIAADFMAAYIDLPNGIVSSQTNLTIEVWATPLSAPSYARLIDFGRTVEAGNGAPGEWTGLPGTPAPGGTSSSDSIMLSAAIGSDITAQRFEAKLNGTSTKLDADLATIAGVPHHYAITFGDGAGSFGAAGGRFQWYRDGDPIAYLDVNYHLADIEDVNNWLGRSQWSNDQMANNEYTEVRISSVAMSHGEVMANYLLGPGYQADTTVLLSNSDALGTSSFNTSGQWSSGVAPNGADSYETLDFRLRTPPTASSYLFGGNTLKISGGELLYNSTGSSTITVPDLQINGGEVHHSGSGTMTMAGNIAITPNGAQFHAQNGPINLTAPLSGLAPVTFIGGNTVTLLGNNSGFAGKTSIGNGWFGSVAIDSVARLGAAPAGFTSDHLTLNRGTLLTTATMTLSNDNRGILLDVSGGTFNVAGGTTLTVASILSSPGTAANLVAGSLTKTGGGTLVLSSPSNTFKGTLFVDTSRTGGSDGAVRIASSQVLADAHSPIFIRNNNSGSSTLQLDGASGEVSLSQGINVSCRNNAVATIQNLGGTNTLSGFIALNTGGNMFNIQSDAGLLVFSGNHQYIGSLTGGRTYNFTGSGHHLVSGAILNSTNGAPIGLTKSGVGTLTLAGNNTYGSTTTVSGGTLLVNGSIGSSGVTVANPATLGGSGVVNGTVTLQSGSTLAPGASIGTLTVNSSVTLQAGSTSRMEISAFPQANDQLLVNGTLHLGGNLVVTNLGGTLTPGDSFALFGGTSINGGFASSSLPPLDSGLNWDTSGLTNGTLSVVAVPPQISAIQQLGDGNFQLAGSGAAGATYELQGTTNLLPPIVWLPLTNTPADGGGLFQMIDEDATNHPQRFYRVEGP